MILRTNTKEKKKRKEKKKLLKCYFSEMNYIKYVLSSMAVVRRSCLEY